jgi:hypothetical protein
VGVGKYSTEMYSSLFPNAFSLLFAYLIGLGGFTFTAGTSFAVYERFPAEYHYTSETHKLPFHLFYDIHENEPCIKKQLISTISKLSYILNIVTCCLGNVTNNSWTLVRHFILLGLSFGRATVIHFRDL